MVVVGSALKARAGTNTSSDPRRGSAASVRTDVVLRVGVSELDCWASATPTSELRLSAATRVRGKIIVTDRLLVFGTTEG